MSIIIGDQVRITFGRKVNKVGGGGITDFAIGKVTKKAIDSEGETLYLITFNPEYFIEWPHWSTRISCNEMQPENENCIKTMVFYTGSPTTSHRYLFPLSINKGTKVPL